MNELVEYYRMDRSHLLQAEADIHALTKNTLAALAGKQSVEMAISRLQQGELFYCTDSPQRPYCVYFRGKYYLNPAAIEVTAPQAINRLRSRYAFISIDDEPLVEVRYGALIRQYYTSQRPLEPTPTLLPELTHVEMPKRRTVTPKHRDVTQEFYFSM